MDSPYMSYHALFNSHKTTIDHIPSMTLNTGAMTLLYVGIVLLSITIFIGGLIHISVFVPLGNTGK